MTSTACSSPYKSIAIPVLQWAWTSWCDLEEVMHLFLEKHPWRFSHWKWHFNLVLLENLEKPHANVGFWLEKKIFLWILFIIYNSERVSHSRLRLIHLLLQLGGRSSGTSGWNSVKLTKRLSSTYTKIECRCSCRNTQNHSIILSSHSTVLDFLVSNFSYIWNLWFMSLCHHFHWHFQGRRFPTGFPPWMMVSRFTHKLLVSHSLPASMALWRPMSISWISNQQNHGFTSHNKSWFFHRGPAHRKEVSESFQHLDRGVFFCPKILMMKKKHHFPTSKTCEIWMLMKQIPQFMALDGPPSPRH